MDKQLLKAYIRTIVEEEVTRLLPKMLSEAVQEIKAVQGAPAPARAAATKPPVDRKRLAELMGLDYDRNNGTLSAFTPGLNTPTMQMPADVDPDVSKAITRDYSQLMKAMKIT